MAAENEFENDNNKNVAVVDDLRNDNAVVENEDSAIEELPGNYPFNKSYLSHRIIDNFLQILKYKVITV